MKGLGYLLLDAAYYALAVACILVAYRVAKQTRTRLIACIAVAAVFLAFPAAKRLSFSLAENRYERLCATEAGETIKTSVDGIKGILVMRPREKIDDSNLDRIRHLQWDQFELEDPY